MEFVAAFLSGLTILLVGYFIYCKVPVIKAATAPFAACCAIMLFLLLCSWVNLLLPGTILVYFAAVAILVWAVMRSRANNVKQYFVSPGVVFFFLNCVAMVILYTVIKDTFFTQWDEFSHWGPFYKNIFTEGKLPFFYDSPLIYDGYPRASTVFYFFTSFLLPTFSEPSAFISVALLYGAAYATLLGNMTWKHPILSILGVLCGFFFFIPFFTGAPYVSIMQDALLGALWGASIVFVFATEKLDLRFSILLAVVLAVLTQLKEIGLLFAAITGGAYLLCVLFRRGDEAQGQKKLFFKRLDKIFWRNTAIAAAPPLLVYTGWQFILRIADGSQGYTQGTTSQLGAFLGLLRGIFTGQSEAMLIWDAFKEAMTQYGVFFDHPIRAMHVLPVMGVLILGTGLYLSYRKKRRFDLLASLYLLAALAVYLVVCLFLIFTFGSYLAAHIPRYLSTILVGVSLGWIGLVLYSSVGKIKVPKLNIAMFLPQTALLAAILSICSCMVIKYDWLQLRRTRDTLTRDVFSASYVQQISSYLPEDARVWVLAQGPPDVSFDKYQYSYALYPLFVPAYNMPYSLATQEEYAVLLSQLKAENISHVLLTRTDLYLNDNYSAQFSDALVPIIADGKPTLYEVEWDVTGDVRFESVFRVE